MENEKEIHISSTCDCSFHTSLRDIIDIGLKPSIQNATTIIAASLLNTALFGNYTVDFLFMIGNVFTISRDLLLYETYKIISQEAISASIEMKEKDARGFILQENLCELLQQAIESQSYMYNSFDIGLLHQVSREAYGIYVKEFYKNGESYSGAESSMPFLSCINYNGDGTIISSGKDTVMIVLQQGQQVPNMGVLKQFDVGFQNTVKDKDKDDYQLQLELVRLRHSADIILEETVSLDEHFYDIIESFLLYCDHKVFVSPICLEMKHIYYNSSLQLHSD